jgi:hypothetical protein
MFLVADDNEVGLVPHRARHLFHAGQALILP